MTRNSDSLSTQPQFFLQAAERLLRDRTDEARQALHRRHITLSPTDPLHQSYAITLSCPENLPLEPVKKTLLKQIEVAADFIRDFHIGVLGQHTTILQLYEIELVVEKRWSFALGFESGKLLIYLPYWRLKFLSRYLKHRDLKQRWNQGKPLQNSYPPSLTKLWWLFNPIGIFRSSLRSTLLLAIQRQVLGLDKLLLRFSQPQEEAQRPAEHPAGEGLKNSAIALLKSQIDEEKLGVDLELALKDYDNRAIVQLLGLFKQNLTDAQQIEEMVDVGSLTLHEVLTKEQSQVDVKMFGFVNVGNYHRIDVELNFSTGYLRKYVEVVPRRADLKAVQFGFVNVYTIDDITVQPNFHSAVKLDFETAALEQALKQLSDSESSHLS